MEYRSLSIAVTVGLAFVLAACGGGGSGTTAPTASNLTGTWYGNYDLLGTATTISVVVGSGNSVTSVSIGAVDAGLTGSIALIQNSLYGYTLYQGTALYDQGGFLVDAAAQHAGFLSSQGDFGVVEKGGAATTYADSDKVGTWSGYTIRLDVGGNVTGYSTSSVTVAADGSFTGTDSTSGAFQSGLVNLSLSDATYGTYTGTFDSTVTTGGDMKVWISPDKMFAASYACVSGTTPATGLHWCNYSSWVKQ